MIVDGIDTGTTVTLRDWDLCLPLLHMTDTVRFVLADGDRIMVEWPDCGWNQAWRLVHLFGKMEGPGSMFIYVDPAPKPVPRATLREIQQRVWKFGMSIADYKAAIAAELEAA